MRSTPFTERLGEAGGGVGALLVAVVERRGGAAAVGDQFVDADRGIDDAAAGEAELLVVAGHGQERLEVGRGVVEIADAVALVERVVVAIAVGLDGVAVERGRPRSVIGRGRESQAMRWLNEPTPASARIATGGPPTPFFSTMLMTPPIALSPYSTAPLLPRVISMRSIELRGMVEKSTPAMSTSLSLRPLMSTRVLEVAKAPKPRRSTLVFAPLTPPNRLVSCTPGVCAMISCNVCAGECAISSRGDDGRRRADDAGELPAGASARAVRGALRCDVRAGAGCGPVPVDGAAPARRGARSILHRRSVLRGSGSGRWAR